MSLTLCSLTLLALCWLGFGLWLVLIIYGHVPHLKFYFSGRRVLGSENPIPPRDRESRVNATNKAEFIELASQGQPPTQTHRSDWADQTPSLFREDLI
jgi:hypothetical protein